MRVTLLRKDTCATYHIYGVKYFTVCFGYSGSRRKAFAFDLYDGSTVYYDLKEYELCSVRDERTTDCTFDIEY